MPSPLVRQIHDETGARCSLCQGESVVQDGELLQTIPRLTERVTEGPMQEEHPGRFDGDGQFAHQSKGDGGHPAGFYFPCQQSHGSRADRSSRHQQDEIDVGLSEPRAYLMAWKQQIVRIVGKT
jgi:hypothetical protein